MEPQDTRSPAWAIRRLKRQQALCVALLLTLFLGGVATCTFDDSPGLSIEVGKGWDGDARSRQFNALRAEPASMTPKIEPRVLLNQEPDGSTAGQERPERAASANDWVERGDTLMQASRDRMETDHYAEAEQAYHQALQLDPDCADAWVGLAWVCNSRHEFDQGRRWAQRAIAADPDRYRAYLLMGDADVESGNYEGAFENYQRALDLRPDLSTYSRAAHLLWLTGDDQRACRLMRNAIDAGGPHAENTAWCRSELALMLLHSGALNEAEREIEKALREAAGNPHVLAAAGQIRAAGQDYEAAIEFYRQSVAVRPTHGAMVALGDLFEATGRREEAERVYALLVALHEEKKNVCGQGSGPRRLCRDRGNIQLARFYADHDRNLDEALSEAERARRASNNVFVLDTLAWCTYKKGRGETARKIMEQALHWNTPDPFISFHAGMIYAGLGDVEAARTYLGRALRLTPHFHPKYAQLAEETLRTLSSTEPSIH